MKLFATHVTFFYVCISIHILLFLFLRQSSKLSSIIWYTHCHYLSDLVHLRTSLMHKHRKRNARRDVGLLAVMQTILSLSSRWHAVAFAAPPFVTFQRLTRAERVAVFSRENQEPPAALNGGDERRQVPDGTRGKQRGNRARCRLMAPQRESRTLTTLLNRFATGWKVQSLRLEEVGRHLVETPSVPRI